MLRREKEDVVLILGRRGLSRKTELDDVRIAYAIHIPPDKERVARASRALTKRSRRRPMTKEELGVLLEDMAPDRLYEGPECVREALRTDRDLREAMGRLGALLMDSRREKKGVRVRR